MSSLSRFGPAAEGALENHQQLSSACSITVTESSRPQRKVSLKVLLQKLPKLIVVVFHKPLEKFTLFPKLPKELRTMIWTEACRVPRKVQLEHFRWIPKNSLPPPRFEGQTIVPAILHVCPESRLEALRWYTAAERKYPTGVESPVGSCSLKSQRFTYTNLSIDTFVYSGVPLVKRSLPPRPVGIINSGHKFTFNTQILSQVKFVEIPTKYLCHRIGWNLELAQMKSLEEITLFHSFSCQSPFPSRCCINASPDEQLYQRVSRKKRSDRREISMDDYAFMGDQEAVRWVEMDVCRDHPDNIYRNHLDLERNWDDCLTPYEG